ncbi:MAG: dihydrolipoamide acetyltransferase family protein [Aestuariivirga sp.]
MSRFVFKLPDIGEGVAEAEIVKWHVKADEEVAEGQAFVDVMTDKATVEISAPVSGIIRVRNGEEGAKLAVGAELAVFETGEEDRQDAPVKAVPSLAPKAGKVAAARGSGKALASPAVRARAASLGIDLATMKGSGPEGRVVHADLDGMLTAKQEKTMSAPTLAALEEGAEDIKIFGLRRRIAERMQDAKRRIPHFAYVEEVDVTALEALRAELNAAHGSRQRITMLPFIIRAIAQALPRHPTVNSHFDDANGVIRQFTSMHAGIATQTDRGLLVPVIRHAEKMDVWKLAEEITRLSAAARSGKSDRSELAGSTITVTSLGALGGIMATPIVNPPEVAIVGVNRLAERAVVIDGKIEVRKMMNLSSCFDHRIVDGYQAAAFIADVKKALESPRALVT